MNQNNTPSRTGSRNAVTTAYYEKLLARLRQDQLEAALAGRIAESAFFAAEARALRNELAQENALCA